MRNLYLSPSDNDIEIFNYNLRFTETQTEHVAQKIKNALLLFQGEWFLEQDRGIPFFDRILIKNADLDDVNSILIATITGIPEVEELVEFNTSYDASQRTYSVSFKVRMISGELIEGEVTI